MIERLSGFPDNVLAFCSRRSGRPRAAIREIIGGDNIYRSNVAVAASRCGHRASSPPLLARGPSGNRRISN